MESLLGLAYYPHPCYWSVWSAKTDGDWKYFSLITITWSNTNHSHTPSLISKGLNYLLQKWIVLPWSSREHLQRGWNSTLMYPISHVLFFSLNSERWTVQACYMVYHSIRALELDGPTKKIRKYFRICKGISIEYCSYKHKCCDTTLYFDKSSLSLNKDGWLIWLYNIGC